MKWFTFVALLCALPGIILGCRRDPAERKMFDDARLVVEYFSESSEGSFRFETFPYRGGTAVIGANNMAFWVKDGIAYAATPSAREAAPNLKQTPTDVGFGDDFIKAVWAGEETAADRALDEAERLAGEGKYEDALQKHIWYHENALAVDEAQEAVRLSTALRHWIVLGEKYPKALEELKLIRDAKTERIVAGEGDFSLFHDVQSINSYLKETASTVVLFKSLDASNPRLASKVYAIVEPDLVEAREYKLARKYLDDPLERMKLEVAVYEIQLLYAREEAGREFTGSVLRVMTILTQTGELDRARQVQSEALKVLDNSEIRGALGT